MSFQNRLAFVKKEVEKGLAAFFAKKRQEAKKISPHCLVLVDSVVEFTMRGGKRTRAFLCWLGCQSVIARSEATRQSLPRRQAGLEIASPSEWTRNDKLICAMMGIELFQSFALIHDDIIDKDASRRGGPTIHEKFKVESLKFKVRNAKYFGESMAILAGDLALAWADELMGKATRLSLRPRAKRRGSNLSPKGIAASSRALGAPRNDMRIWKVYHQMKQEVIFGQSLDVMEEHMKIGIPRKLINVYKTAWYTVIRPLQIGASLAGASEKQLTSFVPYGLAVGEAYQLRDDFLDGAMSEEEFQKSVQKLVVPKSATILLTNFARFVLTRQS